MKTNLAALAASILAALALTYPLRTEAQGLQPVPNPPPCGTFCLLSLATSDSPSPPFPTRNAIPWPVTVLGQIP